LEDFTFRLSADFFLRVPFLNPGGERFPGGNAQRGLDGRLCGCHWRIHGFGGCLPLGARQRRDGFLRKPGGGRQRGPFIRNRLRVFSMEKTLAGLKPCVG